MLRNNLDQIPDPMWSTVEMWGAIENRAALLEQRLTESDDSEWNDLFKATGGAVAHFGVRAFSESNNHCIAINPTLDALRVDAVQRQTVAYLGNRVNGYGAGLARAVRKIMIEMYDTLS